MTNKLYVGNLNYRTSEEQLHMLFSEVGPVSSVNLITDRASGQSKGFAFIEMQTISDAETAIKRFHKHEVDGRSIMVNAARPQPPRDFGDNNRSRGRNNHSSDRRRRN